VIFVAVYGIYSRKSKFTGKGESIENQLELCKRYIYNKYGDNEINDNPDTDINIVLYEDEGYSGKNTARPEFQRMMADIRMRKLNYVVCYRLDRISRNVGDFAQTVENLEQYKVSFICIKEQFDTTTPMGKAMMNMAAVFAQLERETIAERIRDNMLHLAKTGRWLGGTTPLGFKSEQVEKMTIEGKIKTSFKLVPIQEELQIVELIFMTFLKLSSVTGVESYLIKNDIKTRRNRNFVPLTIKEILSNPVYCIADADIYEYFEKHGCTIGHEKSRFDGRYGISAYNRTSSEGKYQSKRPLNEWIIAVGKHRGIIYSGDWLTVQDILHKNRMYTFKYNPKNKASLLSGLLYCKSCGAQMRPRINSRSKADGKGNRRFYYMCEMKRISNKMKCEIENLPGNALDVAICKRILEYGETGGRINNKVTALKEQTANGESLFRKEIEFLKRQIRETETEIRNLIGALGKSPSDSYVYQYTEQQVKELHERITLYKRELVQKEKDENQIVDFDEQIQAMLNVLTAFKSTYEYAANEEKKQLLHSMVERVEWDGEKIDVFMYDVPLSRHQDNGTAYRAPY